MNILQLKPCWVQCIVNVIVHAFQFFKYCCLGNSRFLGNVVHLPDNKASNSRRQ